MKKFQIKNILIPTDFSDTGSLAVKHAAFMAQLCKAELYLLHVIEISDTIYNIYNPAILINDFADVEKLASKQLNALADSLKKEYGISVKTIYKIENTAYGIVSAVNENNIDLVVMGTHGATGANEFLVGSNAHKTVTLCPCPVITVQANAKKLGFTNIILPIDDALHSRQKVDYTIALAKMYAAKVYVLGFIEQGDDTDPEKFQVKIASVERAIIKAGLSYETKLSKGENFAETTLDYANQIEADLIVVLTEHESRLKSLFLGAFAKKIVNHSKVPVMSIRLEEGYYDLVSLAGSNGA
jgi:nucleotide-binding universal stress UspA family protein